MGFALYSCPKKSKGLNTYELSCYKLWTVETENCLKWCWSFGLYGWKWNIDNRSSANVGSWVCFCGFQKLWTQELETQNVVIISGILYLKSCEMLMQCCSALCFLQVEWSSLRKSTVYFQSLFFCSLLAISNYSLLDMIVTIS